MSFAIKVIAYNFVMGAGAFAGASLGKLLGDWLEVGAIVGGFVTLFVLLHIENSAKSKGDKPE